MRALLSAVGTRGDVQPILALATKIRALGHEVRLCVPPNFVAWAGGFGFEAVPVGVEMRLPASRAAEPPLTPAQLRRLRESMPDLISDQFRAIEAAAEACQVILGANAHQYAARSIAELRGVPYVTALYAPVAIPSPDHAPPPAPGMTWQPGPTEANLALWSDEVRAWNARALERVNDNRVQRGLARIDDVLRHNITDRPWLATDEVLGPPPNTAGVDVFETGAWILDDATPLPRALEAFLEAGAAPIYIGFGSMPAPASATSMLVDAARTLGHRAIISRGWAELEDVAEAHDCIVVDEVNQQALFPRVAVAVHHGGAGTTAAAARAGVPQVVAPMFGDQFYWASRVRALGIGSSVQGSLTSESLLPALGEALEPQVAERAQAIARRLSQDGALVAARRLVAL